MSLTVGLISDTHGLLRDQALHALHGSDFIIHAGDIGPPEILEALGKIAPVTFVRGNTDTASYASSWPVSAVLETKAASFYVLHDLNAIDLNPAAAGVHIVVSGHSHQPRRADHSGVLYINPGSAGPRRFNLPVTVARLDLAARPWHLRFVDLLGGGESADPPRGE